MGGSFGLEGGALDRCGGGALGRCGGGAFFGLSLSVVFVRRRSLLSSSDRWYGPVSVDSSLPPLRTFGGRLAVSPPL